LEFIHKSFQEYFCARLILLGAGANAPLDTRVQRAVQVLSIPNRRIQVEPEVLYLLADHWHHVFSGDSDVSRARECLFAVVAASARGVGIEGGASPNAATILNWMGEPMLKQPWFGVVLDGADLTRAVLCGTSLVDATLTRCRLEKAVLTDVDMAGADLSHVEFGEHAPLVGHSDGVTSVAMCVSPADGRVLVPSGRDNSTVRVGHDLTSDKSLVWSTRSLHQSLDCRGALLSGIVGLTEGQVRLLEQRGATGVRLLNA
jgi:hypothetical protein